jgi:hypothetical protein
MGGKKSKPRERMDAWIIVRDLKLGWHGKKGGKTVAFKFYDKDGSLVGNLGISAATVYWRGKGRKSEARVPTWDLEKLFKDHYQSCNRSH